MKPKIKVLAHTKQQKGKAFERLMHGILDRFGYTAFQVNVHRSGMELDIKARHKGTQMKLVCECKAHEKEIGSVDLVGFLGKHHYLGGSAKFFSLSGFNGTAREWYEDMSNEIKQNFVIYGNDEIYDFLVESSLLAAENELDEIIRRHTKLPLGERFVVFFETTIYVIQILLFEGLPHRYVVLTGMGDLVDKSLYSEIAKLERTIKSLSILNPDILKKVTLKFLDMTNKTPSQLAYEIEEKVGDVEAMIRELCADDLVVPNTSNSFSMKMGLEQLTELARRLLDTTERYVFMESAYAQNLINLDYCSFVSELFSLNLNDDEKNVLIKASQIFPSVLQFTLLGDTQKYKNTYTHLQQLSLAEDKRLHWEKLMVQDFFAGVLAAIEQDLINMPGDHSKKHALLAYSMRKQFKLASKHGILFKIGTDRIVITATAGGSIKAGQLVSYQNESGLMHAAHAMIALQEWDRAIETLDTLISSTGKKDLLAAGWTNKGFCFLQKKNYQVASDCFSRALEYDPNLIQAIDNRMLCLKEIENSSHNPEVY